MDLGALLFLAAMMIGNVYATADKGEPFDRILCEQRLAAGLSRPSHRDGMKLKRLIHVDVRDMVTDLTLEKLRFDKRTFREKDTPLFIKQTDTEHFAFPLEIQISTFEDGKRKLLTEIKLPDPHPVQWLPFTVSGNRTRLTYPELLEVSLNAPGGSTATGYVTDFDPTGVRIYLARENKGPLSIGIDVPCRDLDKYLAGPAFTRRVITPWVELCRVVVLGSEKEGN